MNVDGVRTFTNTTTYNSSVCQLCTLDRCVSRSSTARPSWAGRRLRPLPVTDKSVLDPRSSLYRQNTFIYKNPKYRKAPY